MWKDLSEKQSLIAFKKVLRCFVQNTFTAVYLNSEYSFGIFIVTYFSCRKDEKPGHFSAYLITKQPSCLRKKIGQVNYDLIFLYNENKIIASEALFLAPSSFKACKHYHFDSVLQFNWKDYVTTRYVCFPALSVCPSRRFCRSIGDC